MIPWRSMQERSAACVVHESSNREWICQITHVSMKIVLPLTARFNRWTLETQYHLGMDENLTMTLIRESTWVKSIRKWVYKHQRGAQSSAPSLFFQEASNNLSLIWRTSITRNICQQHFPHTWNRKPPQVSSMQISNKTLRGFHVKCPWPVYWPFFLKAARSLARVKERPSRSLSFLMTNIRVSDN